MSNMMSLIQHHETEINRLHGAIHKAFKLRDNSQADYAIWQSACTDFQRFRSPIDDMLLSIESSDFETDVDTREFAFRYLETDPYYFRSGYMKERILDKIKRFSLTDAEKAVIRVLILTRIETRALREFRRFCRLIPKVEVPELFEEVWVAAQSGDPYVKRRAEFALSYFPRQTGSRFSAKARAPSN